MVSVVNRIAELWWSWMGPMLWQASLLIVLVSALDLVLRRFAWPQVRYALWLLVVLKLILPPAWSLPTGVVGWFEPWAERRIARIWAPEAGAAPQVAPREVSAADGGALPSRQAGDETAAPAAPAGKGLVWQAWAFAAWLLGMAAFAGVLSARIARLRRWHREQRERRTIPPWFHDLLVRTAERLRLGRLPAIVFSEEAVTPAVYGVFRPVLLLPAGYTDSLSAEEAEHVVLHELAHIKRGDLWLHGLSLLLQIAYWFNPLMLWVTRQMKHVREMCCDLTIANVLREKTARYRKTLLDTARALLTESIQPGMGLLGVFEEPFRLVARLRWLEKETWRTRTWAAATAGIVAALMVSCVLPMSGHDPGPRASGPAGLPEGLSVSRSEDSGTDLYVREETWSTTSVFGVRVDSRLASVAETWIGDGRAATREANRTIAVDLRRGTVRLVNHDARSYVEVSHPLDISRHLPASTGGAHPLPSTSGTVRDTGRSFDVRGMRCREYEVLLWRQGAGDSREPRSLTVWTTTDLPVDLRPLHELMRDVRIFFNRDEAVREELGRMQGIQMTVALVTGPIWRRTLSASHVVEIDRRRAPEGVFSVPAGYARRERFSQADF